MGTYIDPSYYGQNYYLTAATTTVYPQVINVNTLGQVYASPVPAPRKNDDMAWLRGQVEEIRELAFST